MRLNAGQDMAAGLIFLAAGVAGFLLCLDLPMGAGARMGPGYMPRALSLGLAGLGAVITARALLFGGTPLPRLAWRPLGLVLASILCFAALLKVAGLVPTVVVAVLVATLAAPDRRWVESIAFAAVLAVFCVAVFIHGLGLVIPIWPEF
ncbi:MAG TPA: tripartite tricarboxylate transporter TctB family protein [Azospirillum sp.]|nr:tripartite tricarboxylate transporter TctB family protein [Azospirillum sp.]